MYNRAQFWSPMPEWPQAVLEGHEVHVVPVSVGTFWQLSGDVSACLARHGVGASLGPRDPCSESSYALRLAPDSVLLVSDKPLPTQSGWQPDGYAISDITDGILAFDISGPNAAALMAQGSEYPFESNTHLPQESARLLFAGLKVIVAQRAHGWRLHIERPWAPALWRWLQAHVE